MGVTVPIFRHRLLPGTGDSAGHIFSWVVCDSPTTEVYPAGDANGDKHRTIRWEPGGKYAERHETWVRRWARVVKGSPARFLNFHIQPADAPDGWSQKGVDGSYTTGVSPVALDWKEGAVEEGQSGLLLTVQPNERGRYKGSPHGDRTHWSAISEAEMKALRAAGEGFLTELRIVWGLADENPAGAVTLWRYDAEGRRIETPVFDVQKVNTRWLNQGMVTLWEGGGYWNVGLGVEVVTEAAPAQVGRTREEMLADVPKLYDHWGTGTMEQIGTYTYPDGGSEPEPEPDDLNVHVVGEPTSKAVTIGWTPPDGQWGYVPTIDGSEKLTDQKRHIGVGADTAQVKIGKPAGGGQHRYGVKILSVEDEGEVTV